MIPKRKVFGTGNRRLLSCLLFGLLASPGLWAQGTPEEAADSTRTVFSEVIYFSLNNGDWIERSEYRKTGRLLHWAQSDTITPIAITGWTDATGTEAFNERLSLRRARTVRNYLVSKGVAAERIRIEGRGVDTRAASDDKARRADVRALVVLLASEPDAAEREAGKATPAVRQKEITPAERQPTEEATPEKEQRQPEKQAASSGRYLGVKTNLAAWAGTVMNIAADVQVGRHMSVELPLLWCPWHISHKHAVKTFTLQPEARYWLSAPGTGHFFGLHAHVGWFNVRWNRDRYQDTDRPLLGAGISYGYLLPLGDHWAGEFTLGAGYANMRYDTYYNIDNGARIDTRSRNYWGITRVGLSVVYRFNLNK